MATDSSKIFIKDKSPIDEVHITLEELIGDTSYLLQEEKYMTIKGLQLYTIKFYAESYIGKEKGTVVGLHGGPSFCHNYILPLKLLAKEGYTVIFYDQVGCGRSSFVVDPVNDCSWLLTLEYYIEELKAVLNFYELKSFYLYGSSWGTMLATEFAVNAEISRGLKGLILDGALADSQFYIKSQVTSLFY